MKIVDYSAEPAVLSWFLQAGIDIEPLLALRRVFNMRGKAAINRVAPDSAFVVVLPVPEFDPAFDLSFSQAMDAEAQALIASGKHIRLAWSGGLDSTAVLMALKKVGAARDQVVIHYTTRSVAEYPALLPWIEQNFESQLVPAAAPVCGPDTLWVTGECGNQIFLPVSRERFDAGLTGPWRDYFLGRADAGAAQAAETLMARCPFPVVSAKQAQWWRVFCLHFQHLSLRQGRTLDMLEFNEFRASNVPFFASAAFQQWSMRMMADPPAEATYLWLKKPMKEYIRSVYPDQHYYDTKTTQPSTTGAEDSRPYVRFEDGSLARSAGAVLAALEASQ